MEWLIGLDVRMVLIVVGALLTLRAGLLRGLRRRPTLLADVFTECSEIAIVSVVVVFLILHRFMFQLFFIPSESMVPTLAVQDRIVVNKWIYRLHSPRRGEVVVFRAPRAASDEPKDYIKRVIGLPGETVAVVPDTICLDGGPLAPIVLASEAQNARGLLVGDGETVRVEPDRVLVNGRTALMVSRTGEVRQLGPSLLVDGRVVAAVAPGEGLRQRPIRPERDGIQAEGTVVWGKNRARLTIVKGQCLSLRSGHVCVNGQPLPESYTREAPRYAMAPVHLAEGQYLVLGDNRNNSKDGHVWGALDGSLLVGRAEAIYWPLNRARRFGTENAAPAPGDRTIAAAAGQPARGRL